MKNLTLSSLVMVLGLIPAFAGAVGTQTTAQQDQGTSADDTPSADNSAPPPGPVQKTDATLLLMCSDSSGNRFSYQISSAMNGATCEKNGAVSASCHITDAQGKTTVLASADCGSKKRDPICKVQQPNVASCKTTGTPAR